MRSFIDHFNKLKNHTLVVWVFWRGVSMNLEVVGVEAKA